MIRGILYGITHDAATKQPLIREPRILKVGIGLSKGRACDVWIHRDGKWKVRVGYKKGSESKVFTCDSAAQARKVYDEQYPGAPVCPYPRKSPFFIFTQGITDANGLQVFTPDWDAIQAHGATPTAIDIVFTNDNPFDGNYQMWSTSELKCKGDGVDAMRVLSMATSIEEKQAATESKEAAEKFFPIIKGCWTCGCPYSQPTVEGGKERPSPCKPGANLVFQLAKDVRLGATAYYHTTGLSSIANIFSSLQTIKMLSGGRLAGIPIRMSVMPKKTMHNGQPGLAYAVVLQPHPEAGRRLISALMGSVFGDGTEKRQIASPLVADETPVEAEDDTEDEPITADNMTAEFYPEESEDDYDEYGVDGKPPEQAKTEDKTKALADKLEAQRAKAEAERKAPAQQATGQETHQAASPPTDQPPDQPPVTATTAEPSKRKPVF
jgi:hypothetical protein